MLAIAAPRASADPYVALGDSIAANAGSYVAKLYPKFQAGLNANELLNRAVGGQSSGQLISSGQLSTALADINAASDTKAVTIDIGGNDRFQCTNGNWDNPGTCPFRANLASILSQLQSALDGDPGTEAFAVMAYYNPGVGTSQEGSYDIGLLGNNLAIGESDTGADAGLNDIIFQEAGKLGIAVADVYPPFKQQGQSLMSGDQIHPNQAGHQAIADVFCATMAPACQAPQTPPPTDTAAPDTTITKAPDNKLDRDKAKYRFTSSETPSTYECKLDRNPFEACTSPRTLKHLEPGRHTFRIRATDAAGNVDQTPATDRFKVIGD
jgi:lysophospholipase L1-like esterase